MENNSGIDILVEYKKLLALNHSLKTRLDEYLGTIKGRDKEIEMLQSMLSEATSYRCNLDNQVNELKNLQSSIGQIQQLVKSSSIDASEHLQLGGSVSEQQQLESLKLQHTNLQRELSNLQAQLIDMNKRNVLLQQETFRIKELERLLENAEDEIARLKQLV